MSARRGFLKLAVRAAIQHLGGIAGGERATGLSSSQVGRWNNLIDADLPGIDHALALDEAALACGGRARILEALAADLGHVAIRLPEGYGEVAPVALQLAEATAEFGDIARAVTDALSDNRICNRDQTSIAAEIDEALIALAKLRALVIEEERGAVVRHIKPLAGE